MRWLSFCFCAAAALGLCITSSGCGDEKVRIHREPISVFAMEFAEPVIASADDSLLVRARVGFRAGAGVQGCELEDASVELRGDSLVVTGVALCRFVERSDQRIARPGKVITPPAEPKRQTFRIPFPTLDPGTYVLIGGDLADTLTVTPATLPAQSSRIAASGHVFAADSCAVFSTTLFDLQYELADTDPPAFGSVARLYGTFAGPPVCDPDRSEALVRPRRIE